MRTVLVIALVVLAGAALAGSTVLAQGPHGRRARGAHAGPARPPPPGREPVERSPRSTPPTPQRWSPTPCSRCRPSRLHPSVTRLSSPWPVAAIWRANQPGAPAATLDLASGGVRLQAWRAGDEVVFRALSPADFAFRQALARAGRLEAGAEAALAVEPDADLAALVRRLLDEQVLATPRAREC
jgi:hypothetical protein